MTIRRWGRLLLIWGLWAVALSLAPALLLTVLPPGFGGTVVSFVAFMLTLSVTPFAAVVASAGAILLLVAALRRDPY